MKKAVCVALLLLLAATAGVFAEVGVGVSAGYPVYFLMDYGFEPEAIFAGASMRWRPSLFQLDGGFSLMLGGGLAYGFLDAGLCFDLLFLRFALGAGVDFVSWYSAELGLNLRTSLDLKFGPVSLGMSGAVPLDALLDLLRGKDISNDLRVLACQPTLNLIFWFGHSSKSRRR